MKKKKVFCYDCEFIEGTRYFSPCCLASPVYNESFVHRKRFTGHKWCDDVNNNGNCKKFQPKKKRWWQK